jgi:hypothetical protein
VAQIVARHRQPEHAWLDARLLESFGIPAEVRGEHRAGLRLELPYLDAMAEVWVADEHVAAATSALAPVVGVRGLVWTCACGEEHEPQFDACWQCGGVRP